MSGFYQLIAICIVPHIAVYKQNAASPLTHEWISSASAISMN
jgi:hypothetical protein